MAHKTSLISGKLGICAVLPVLLLGGGDGVRAAAGPSSAPARDFVTLVDCLDRALREHRDIAGAAALVEGRRVGLSAPWRAYVPNLRLGIAFDQGEDPLFSPYYSYFHPDYRVGTQALDGNFGVVGELPTGTGYQLSMSNGARFYTSYTEALNPRFESGLHLEVTQRLWRGLWEFHEFDAAAARLSLQEAALLEQRDQVLLAVAEAWLELAQAQERVRLQDESLLMARELEAFIRELIRGGQLSRLDLAVTTHMVATRQALAARSRADRDRLAALLSELMGGAIGEGAPQLLSAGRVERFVPSGISGEEVVERARLYSPALARLRGELAAARVEVERAENARRPDVRVRLGGDLHGLSGTSTCRGGYLADGLTPCGVPPGYAGDYGNSYGSMVQARFYGFNVGLEGDIPTFYGPHSDLVEERRLDARSIEARIEAEERRLIWQLRRDLREVEQRGLLLEATTQAVKLAGDSLEAERIKLQNGRSTGLNMLQTQDLVIAAKDQETSARYELARAMVRVRSRLGELLPKRMDLYPTLPPLAEPDAQGDDATDENKPAAKKGRSRGRR